MTDTSIANQFDSTESAILTKIRNRQADGAATPGEVLGWAEVLTELARARKIRSQADDSTD